MQYITKKILYRVTKKLVTGEDEYYGYLIVYNPKMKGGEVQSGYLQWDYDADTPEGFRVNFRDTIEETIQHCEIDGYYTKTPGDHNGPIGYIFGYDHGTKFKRVFPPPRLAVIQYLPDNIYTMLMLDRYGTEIYERFYLEKVDECDYHPTKGKSTRISKES